MVGEEGRRAWMVEVMKAPIWGQTRGCLEEQRMRPSEGGAGEDMVRGGVCVARRFYIFSGFWKVWMALRASLWSQDSPGAISLRDISSC